MMGQWSVNHANGLGRPDTLEMVSGIFIAIR